MSIHLSQGFILLSITVPSECLHVKSIAIVKSLEGVTKNTTRLLFWVKLRVCIAIQSCSLILMRLFMSSVFRKLPARIQTFNYSSKYCCLTRRTRLRSQNFFLKLAKTSSKYNPQTHKKNPKTFSLSSPRNINSF